MSKKITSLLPQIIISLLLVGFFAYAWTEPSQAPPAGNVAAPLNVGNIGQSKQGGLILNIGGLVDSVGLIIDKGSVGIGTQTPAAKLHAVGGVYFEGSGDVNNDGFVNSGDSGLIAQYLSGTTLTPAQYARADINGDGSVNQLDYDLIAKVLVGTVTLNEARNGTGKRKSDTAIGVNYDGKVGIGVTNPTAKLQIGGTAGVDGIKFPDGTLQTTAAAGGGQSRVTGTCAAGSSIRIIAADGSVTCETDDVGITAEADTLQTVTTRGASTNLTMTAQGLSLNGAGSEGNISNVDILQGYNDLRLYGNPTESARIYLEGSSVIINNDAGTGYVGIGTISPAARLHVAGAPGVDGIMFPDGTLQKTAFLGAGGMGGTGTANYIAKFTAATTLGNSTIQDNGTNVGIGGGPATTARLVIHNTADGMLQLRKAISVYTFSIDASGILTLRDGVDNLLMTVAKNTGKVGIGTASPSQKLDVVGGYARSDTGFCIGASCITTWPAGGASQWITSGNNIYYNNGNVGISTTNPNYSLDVNGTIRSNILKTGNPVESVDLSQFNGDSFDDWAFYTGNEAGCSPPTLSPQYTYQVFKDSSTGSASAPSLKIDDRREITGNYCYNVRSGVRQNFSKQIYGTFLLSFKWRSESIGSLNELGDTVYNHSFMVKVGGKDYYIYDLGSTISDTGWQSFSRDFSGELSGISSVTVDIGFKYGDQINFWLDDIRVEAGAILTSGDIWAQGKVYAQSLSQMGDIAEYMSSEEEGLKPGQILSLGPKGVVASKKPYDQKMAGVFSANPSVLINAPQEGVPVGLVGVVSVFVTDSAGPIKRGDPITSSAKPGYGMLASGSGTIIGIAQEDLIGQEGQIKVQLMVGRWWQAE